jgi:NADH dehydrogenase
MFVGAEVGSAVLDDHAKRSVEQALQQSGIPSTIFKPTYFMDTLPKQLQGKRAMIIGTQPHPLHLVAASDFGRMVSRAFQVPEAANKIFYIQGPEALTMAEALHLYCTILEPEKQVTTMPLWLMSVVDTLFLRKQMRRTLQIMQVLQRSGEFGDPSEANRILGAPTTTLRAWCEQQRTFRSRESHISI